MIGQDLSVSKANWLQVDIFQNFLYRIEVYSVNSSRMMGNIPEVFNLNGVICNQRLVLPVQWLYNSFGQSDCVLKYTDCIVAYVIVVIPLVR